MQTLGTSSDRYAELKRYAISLLSRQELTQKMLAQRLRRYFDKNGWHPSDESSLTSEQLEATLESLLVELAEAGWQSDARFVESFVRIRLYKGFGRHRIQQEAQQKHIPADLLDEYLDLDAEQWLDNGVRLYSKKYGGKTIASPQDKQRRLRYLQYRGYSIAQCLQIIEHCS